MRVGEFSATSKSERHYVCQKKKTNLSSLLNAVFAALQQQTFPFFPLAVYPRFKNESRRDHFSTTATPHIQTCLSPHPRQAVPRSSAATERSILGLLSIGRGERGGGRKRADFFED
jgi:hypothetical protein